MSSRPRADFGIVFGQLVQQLQPLRDQWDEINGCIDELRQEIENLGPEGDPDQKQQLLDEIAALSETAHQVFLDAKLLESASAALLNDDELGSLATQGLTPQVWPVSVSEQLFGNIEALWRFFTTGVWQSTRQN